MATSTFQPVPRGLTGYPVTPSELAVAKDAMLADLIPHMHEFDAVACAGDFHGVALASLVAAGLYMPLVIVCQPHHDVQPTETHQCVVSHIVMIGEFHPAMRVLYVDDMFSWGKSLKHVRDYVDQSEQANLVATYEYLTRKYSPTTDAS